MTSIVVDGAGRGTEDVVASEGAYIVCGLPQVQKHELCSGGLGRVNSGLVPSPYQNSGVNFLDPRGSDKRGHCCGPM